MANDDVTLRVSLVDEASRPIANVRRQVQEAGTAINKTGATAKSTARDLSSLDTAANRVGTSVGRMASSLLVADRHGSSFSRTLRNLGFGYLGYQAAQFGVQAVTSFQNAQTALTGLVGSQQQAAALMRQLQAIKSPFGQSALTSSAQSLLAMGVGSDRVVGSVQAIADAVARVGGGSSGLSSVTQTLGDIASSAQVSEGQLSSLRSQGLDAFSVLGKSRGLSGTQMQQAISLGAFRESGKSAYDELIAGFEAQAKGSAGQQAGSLGGSLQQVSDSAARSLNAVLAPNLPQITKFIDTAASELPGLAHAAGPFLTVLGKTLGVMADHPHLTEALAGFLVFREVAGPALRTADAISMMVRDLRSVNSVSGAAQILSGTMLGTGGMAGGGTAAGGTYGPGMPTLLSAGGAPATASKWGERAGKYGTRGLSGGLAALTASQLGGAGQNFLTARFGHGNDGKSWHWQDAARGAYGVGKDAGEGALLGGSLGGLPGAAIGAVGGTLFGAGKETWDYFHHKKTYSMSDSGKQALAIGALNVSVAAGETVDQVVARLAQDPNMKAAIQTAIDTYNQQAAQRKQVPYP